VPPPTTHVYNPPQQSNMETPRYDPEDPDAGAFEFTDDSIRKGFIRKVFSILSVSNTFFAVPKLIRKHFIV
jgi:hypothetical protein